MEVNARQMRIKVKGIHQGGWDTSQMQRNKQVFQGVSETSVKIIDKYMSLLFLDGHTLQARGGLSGRAGPCLYSDRLPLTVFDWSEE